MDMTLIRLKEYNEELLKNSTKSIYDTLASLLENNILNLKDSKNSSNPTDSSNYTLILVGIIFGCLSICFCCFIGFFFWKRRYVQCYGCKLKMTKKEYEKHIHECCLKKVVVGTVEEGNSKVCPYKEV
jgi:hypothetical protein